LSDRHAAEKLERAINGREGRPQNESALGIVYNRSLFVAVLSLLSFYIPLYRIFSAHFRRKKTLLSHVPSRLRITSTGLTDKYTTSSNGYHHYHPAVHPGSMH
jgi:hypothetical protein